MSARDILHFHYRIPTYPPNERIISDTSQRRINANISRLKDVMDNLPDGDAEIDGQTASEVYHNFLSYYKSKKALEKRDIRRLSSLLKYAPEGYEPIFSSVPMLKSAIELFRNNWRDTFLSGLIRCVLTQWKSGDRESFKLLLDFINTKVKSYEGRRKSILAFQDNRRYLTPKNGTLLLAKDLINSEKSILDAEAFCGIPSKWLPYEYFVDVIIKYYRSRIEKHSSSTDIQKLIERMIEDLKSLFENHHHKLTKQMVMGSIINFVAESERSFGIDFQKYIQKEAFKIVGDPANNDDWRPDANTTVEEKETIEKAREILNNWISRDFIKVFFEKCISDEDRKRFWLNIAQKYSISFKLVGTFTTRKMLKNIESVSEYVESRFITTQTDTSVTAIVMYIGKYMIVEFARIGHALYAYKQDGRYTPSLEGRIRNHEALKNRDLETVRLGELDEREEGRFSHQGEWQVRLNSWLEKFVLNN